MAPTGTAAGSCNNGQKCKNAFRQLSKAEVEKLRRDRINSSIRQLRLQLESEFQSHQPNTKLEKADILEMTVSYLKKRHILVNATSSSTKKTFQGYSQCLQETLHYLSYPAKMDQANEKVMQYFNRGCIMSSKSPGSSPTNSERPLKHVIWRPW
ncbi:transcription factor HES-5-like [Dendrobates tinctorius]|uniref:transcription factor HES-5-like n=1 Tax=Dendrobates tinctorius TaxID=92724 RepID=UPI003CCA185D